MSNSSSMLHPGMWPGELRTSLPHRRTKQACDNCKARKAKCSNTKPCTNCQEADILCTSVKAMTRKSARDWEIETLRSERTRLAHAVKVLHQQLSSRAPELYAPPTTADSNDPTAPPIAKTPPTAPPAEKLSVNEIVELIELGQKRKKHGGSDNDPIHVTPATPSSPSLSSYRSEAATASDGFAARRRRRRRLSSSAGRPLTPSNTPVLTPDTAATTTTVPGVVEAQQQQQQQSTDVMTWFGPELDCVDDFRWQPPDGVEDLPSCWAAGSLGEEWPGPGVGGGGLPGGLLGLDGMDQLSMDWTAGEGGAVWR